MRKTRIKITFLTSMSSSVMNWLCYGHFISDKQACNVLKEFIKHFRPFSYSFYNYVKLLSGHGVKLIGCQSARLLGCQVHGHFIVLRTNLHSIIYTQENVTTWQHGYQRSKLIDGAKDRWTRPHKKERIPKLISKFRFCLKKLIN